MGTKLWCQLYMGYNFLSHAILHVTEYLIKLYKTKIQSYAIYRCDQNFIHNGPDKIFNLM
jgi:hypothetical protein